MKSTAKLRELREKTEADLSVRETELSERSRRRSARRSASSPA